MSGYFFMRDDDVWRLDHEFMFFFDLAIEHRLPVIYAVIPGKIDEETVRFLCRAKEKTPQLLDIVQHGWMHTDHSTDPERKYEFGPSRSFQAQRNDIRRGLKKMRAAFGGYFTPAFVPPYHGYDERTLRVIDQEGYHFFSAGNARRGIKKQFRELPAQVSFSQYEKGGMRIQDAKDVLDLLIREVTQRPLSGVVMHHADFKHSSRKELRRFFDLLRVLRDREEWRSMLFSDLRGK